MGWGLLGGGGELLLPKKKKSTVVKIITIQTHKTYLQYSAARRVGDTLV